MLVAAVNVVGALALIPDRGGDFAMLYRSTAAWVDGLSPYASPGTPTSNLNHPLVWLVVFPFLVLPEPVAFVCWTILSLLLFVAVALRVSGIGGLTAFESIVITLSLTGTAFGLALGQLSFVLMLLLTGAWWFDRSGRVMAAGVCIGLLCVLKPFYGLFAVMLLWRREWTGALACAATGVCAVIAGWILAGTDGYLAWLQNLRHVTWTWHVFNGSIWGVAARLFGPQQIAIATEWTPLAVSPSWSGALVAVGVALTVTLLVRGVRRGDIDGTYALLALGSLLLSPLGWVYYLPASFGPVLVTLARRPSPWLWALGALAFCPYGLLVNRHYGMAATATVGQISFVVVGGLFLLVYANTRRRESYNVPAGRV